MKKYLLFLFAMLTGAIGAWADDPTSGTFGTRGDGDKTPLSTWALSDNVLTLTFNKSSDIPSKADQWGNPDVAPLCSIDGVTKVVVSTSTGVTLSGGWGSPLHSLNRHYKSIPLLDVSNAYFIYQSVSASTKAIQMSANDGTFSNVIVPAEFSSDFEGVRITGLWGYDEIETNKYSLSGTTVNAALNKTDGMIALATISSTATTLKIVDEVGAIDLSSVLSSGQILDLTAITTASDNSNDITVADGVKVVCLSDGVKDRVKGTDAANITVANPVISCTATELAGKLTALTSDGVAPVSITITSGVLSAEDLSSLNKEGLKYLSLQDATLASGVAVSSITLPSTLEAFVLPKSATPESACTESTLLAKIKANTSLKYVYAPYSGTQNKGQMVADYVWVSKPGGLNEALNKEVNLKTAVYVKIASDVANGVALNNDDANFGSHSIDASSSEDDYPWQYIDMSGTIVTAPATLAATAPHAKGYRIILPNNLTGDNMAIFASNSKKGAVAAVYSYDGTRLNLMELTDNTYHTNALADSRIVRTGTTEVRIVSGSYGGNTYSKFGPNLLAALNEAAPSITSATIAVGDGIYTTSDTKVNSATTFSFTNPRLTSLTMNYIKNEYLTVNVSGCTALTSLYLNETTLAGVDAAWVDAQGVSSLTTASLGHATIGGDVNLSGTALTALLEVDLATIKGTLNISSTRGTSYDLTQVTAKKVDASKTASLTSLDINGISLNGGSWAAGDENKDGKIEVTRTGGNYSGLNIIRAEGFDVGRIIPSSAGYTVMTIAPSHVEITAAGSNLSSTVPGALTAYNAAQDPTEENTVANVEILHVTGRLTADDITYIKTSLTGLKLLDLSGCKFAEGVGVSTIASAPIPTTTAIVLPGTTNTEESTISNVKTLQDAGYECVAYYTEKKTNGIGRLSVYGYNGTVANLKSVNPAIVDKHTCITFLQRYGNTTVGSAAHTYPEATPSLITALEALGESASVDMTWLNISNLGTDFSHVNTHYLVIPQNSSDATITRNGIVYNNDFSVKDDENESTVEYKYHSNVDAVSTYKGKAAPYATMAYFGGDALNYDNGYGHKDQTAHLMYVRKAGCMGSFFDYVPDLLKNADVLAIAGTINNKDWEQSTNTNSLSDVTNKYLDLTRAKFETEGKNPVSWSDFDNDNVKYMALPYDFDSDGDSKTTLNDLSSLQLGTRCSSLVGVGTLVKSSEIITNSTKKSQLIYQSYSEGGVGNVIKMLHALNQNERAYQITSLAVAGPVNARDLSTQTTGIDDDGHLMTTVDESNMMTVSGGGAGSLSGYAGIIESFDLTGVTLPTYTAIKTAQKTYAFDNATHAYATTESGSFSFQNDLCFSKLGIASDKFITVSYVLPTDKSVWRMPTDAFNNVHGLEELCLPYNYQYIGNGAFLDTYLTHITTTDAAGNVVDNGAHSYTLSANLKELGDNPGVGNALTESQTVFPQNREVYDVYILATDVPKCYAGVFAANVLYGWGGFRGSDFPYCRDKYINGSNWFCVLRYPYKGSMADAAYLEMEKKYTDVYKIYTKLEQTGAMDANGKEILWPTFSELRRVSTQALSGKVWYDWDTAYEGQHEVNTGSSYDSSSYIKEQAANPSLHYDFDDYKGWHQFVLTQAAYVTTEAQNAREREYVQGGWYTFCFPYDMTESQVYEMLGVPYSSDQHTNKFNGSEIIKSGESTDEGKIERLMPDIRTLKAVMRQPNPGGTNHIVMTLTENLASSGSYQYWKVSDNESEPSSKFDDCGTVDLGSGDEKIVIKGGYPYYIKPYLLKGETVNNLGQYVMMRYIDKFRRAASCERFNVTHEYVGSSGTEEVATLRFAKPYEGHKIWAYYDDNDDDTPRYQLHHKNSTEESDRKYYYTFVGQFWDQPLPHYCYYTVEGTGKWYRFTRFDESTENYKWRAYKCVILCTDEVDDTSTHPNSGKFRNSAKSTYPVLVEGSTDKLSGSLYIEFLNGIDDYDFEKSSRQCIFIFDDEIMGVSEEGSPTGISRLDGVDILPVGDKVYNMAGQQVGNSLEGLSSGVYIVNGRKIVVK